MSINLFILYQQLIDSFLFKEWQKKNQGTVLSHFFCSLTSSFKNKTNWEIGFYNPNQNKMVVFAQVNPNEFQVKPEEDIFKKEETKVEELILEKIKINYFQSKDILKKELSKFFPQEQLGDGFVVLQTLNQKILWNYTFIGKDLQLLNLKINSETGEVFSHGRINLIQK